MSGKALQIHGRRAQPAIIGSNLLAVGNRVVPLLFEKNERARRIIYF